MDSSKSTQKNYIMQNQGSESPKKKKNLKITLNQQVKEPQLFEIDQKWAELKIDGNFIKSRSYHSMSLYNGTIYIYGGFDQKVGILDDFISIKIQDAQSYKWEKVCIDEKKSQMPGQRRRHTSVVYNDKLYIFGGQNNTIYNTNELHEFDFQSKIWKKIELKGEIPPPIDSHQAILYEQDDQMIVVCGYLGDKICSYSQRIYSFNFKTYEWKILFKQLDEGKFERNVPKGRGSQATALYKNQIYIQGGSDFDRKFKDFWKFDIESKNWYQIETKGESFIEQRSGHQMVEYKDSLYIFGGIQDITKEKNDIFQYDIANNTWSRINFDKKIPEIKNKQDSFNQISPTKKVGRGSPVRNLRKGNQSQGQFVDIRGQQQEQQIIEIGQYSYQDNEQINSYLDMRKQQMLAVKKYEMLKDIVYNVDENIKNENIEPVSPISKHMKHSIQNIGDPRSKKQEQGTTNEGNSKLNLNTQNSDQQQNSTFQSSCKKNDLENLNISSSMKQDLLYQQENQNFQPVRQYLTKNNKNLLIGKKPCARDGAGMVIYKNNLIIFGGDRHLMACNDIYAFNLEDNIIDLN